MTPVTGLGPVFIVAGRTRLQTLPPLPQVHVAVATAQTVCVAATRTLAAGGVAALARHGGGVAEVTENAHSL